MEDFVRYIHEIVEPTLRDFEENPSSVRHAFLACVVACHSVDYLTYPKRATQRRQAFVKRSADFKIVDDVAHAFKHVIVGPRGHPRFKAANVIGRPPARAGQMMAGLSRLGDATGGVTLANDIEADMLEITRRAVDFLRSQIKE